MSKGKRRLLVVVVVLVVLTVAGVAASLWLRRPPLVSVDERPKTLLIKNVRVVDVLAGAAREAVDVSVEGAVIRAIEPHDPSRSADRVIDGAGASLVPGLIDIHVHIDGTAGPPWYVALPDPGRNLEQFLYCGITRVVDPGNRAPAIFELRDEVDVGERIGPFIYAAGPLFTAPGGHPVPLLRIAAPSFLADFLIEGMVRQHDDPAQAAADVTTLAEQKPDFIKLVIDSLPDGAPRLDSAVAKAVATRAHELGLRALAHIGTTKDAIEAAEAGADAWIHGVYKERISDEDIQRLAGYGIPMAPTMVVFLTYSQVDKGDYPATALEREIAPPDALAARAHAPEDFDWGSARVFLERITKERQSALDNVRRLAAAGVTILAGSDAQGANIHGASLHVELGLLAKAGLSPIEVLQSATLHNARFLSKKKDPPFGIVAKGKRADLLLVEGDPLASVSALSKIRAVVQGGVPIERHAATD